MSSLQTFIREETLPVSAAEAFAWHERPGAFERLTPPWERVELVERSGAALQPGSRVTLRTRLGPVAMEWVAEHTEYVAGRMFRDVALSGPFASWDHRHEFLDTPGLDERVGGGDADGAGGAAGAGCTLRDRVKYALPGGMAGRVVAGGLVRRKLAALFAYRQAVTRDDLRFALDHAGAPRLRVLVTGASGLIGRALVPFLTSQGHEVVRLVRGEAGRRSSPQGGAATGEPWWDPVSGEIDLAPAGRIDAVVHLAGAGIADARWTEGRRRVLRDSRVIGTRLLAEALALTALLGATLKDAGGQLTLQAQTEAGIVDLLVADYKGGELRGYVRFDGERLAEQPSLPSLFALFGKGYLAITFDQAMSGERYQGIVPLEGGSLAEAVEHFFVQSEQIPSLIRLAAGAG
ncbi:MAG: Hsp33 family molecular chaperone HslO, partial [Burkholderiales bacterium]|nr:Hsp33 family molecular chaperone HslO [Opitutaceae bacterium]